MFLRIQVTQLFVFISLIFAMTSSFAAQDACMNNKQFNIGAAKYDITGPAAEQGMMGYGMLGQKTGGIYQRLFARAFVIESPCNGKRVVFVNADLGQLFQGIKQQVIIDLQKKYGKQYSDENVLLTAIHTHSGPGGYSTYAFYNLTTLGFSRDNFNAISKGIVAAIEAAQTNMRPATIKIAKGDVNGVSFNRSQEAYLLNPIQERIKYPAPYDTEMTLLRFDGIDGKPIGILNWFPLHGTSMNNKNYLINGDNKGYAEYLFEKDMHDHGYTNFVAAFAQANAGDVSPNDGKEGGNAKEGLLNIERAGKPQYDVAKQLYLSANRLVQGSIDYRHSFISMSDYPIAPEFTGAGPQLTCPAAIGLSMLAGTQDGEGFGRQGLKCDEMGSVIPNFVCRILTSPCQGNKPIVITTGKMSPHPWTPQILPFQVMTLGNVVVGAVPMELTTMTGRRLKTAIASQLPTAQQYDVVLSALANSYAGYVATREEYAAQRYEGASTHFGPWSEAALRQIYSNLTLALINGNAVNAGPQPENLIDGQINLQTGVVYDSAGGTGFGSLYQKANANYRRGNTVSVVFWGAHPKNNFHTEDTFLEVQRFENNQWKTILQDRDWNVSYTWKRSGMASSLVIIEWMIPVDAVPGTYRIKHKGDWKAFWTRKISPYEGYSNEFQVG